MANKKRLDLISRKQVLKELRQELKECRADGEGMGGESILWAEGIEFAIDAVKQTERVDAVEVVHGRLGVSYVDEYYGEFAKCSVCGAENIVPSNYCSNCGAKMDGGNDYGR